MLAGNDGDLYQFILGFFFFLIYELAGVDGCFSFIAQKSKIKLKVLAWVPEKWCCQSRGIQGRDQKSGK